VREKRWAGIGLVAVALVAGYGTASALTGSTSLAGSGPAAGNRAEALAFGRQLLSKLVLPPGTQAAHVSSVPQELQDAWHPSAGSADLGRLFLARQPMSAVYAFLLAHVPDGLRVLATGQGRGRDGITSQEVDFVPGDLPAGIESAYLDVRAGPWSGGTALIGAYVRVTWFPGRGTAERFSAGSFNKVTVSALVDNPKLHRVTRTFTSSALIARLTGFLNGLHAAPDGARSCPAGTVSYQLTFVSGRVPEVVVSPDGCSAIGVTVAGRTQPALWDQYNVLASMAGQLLGISATGY
jgi:hypothetical protein